MTYRAPKGTDDILPPASYEWVTAERVFLDLAERYGYGLVLTPLFESTELFSRGIGEATEVVEKQMYTFTDKGGRSVTLRPEGTASVVRALIQAGGVVGTFKGFYWGPMFRYERPQKGRRRQFSQAGIEYLGEASFDADVEVIEFGYRYLEELGVRDVEVQLNSIGDGSDRSDYRAELTAFLESRKGDLSEDAVRRLYENPMRVLDSKADADVVAGRPDPGRPSFAGGSRALRGRSGRSRCCRDPVSDRTDPRPRSRLLQPDRLGVRAAQLRSGTEFRRRWRPLRPAV